ncbi:nose resistant to fluoxetine protein 6-like [Toxorhynchites rutilus septentrionalis]|uniref:nose resistant to fluoxetine protein 6-like n=1 Tax=Toxorhynchites rutilus septentrionalis TaxID=329112 RepID=UPI0024793907|nr:nose resistant to fluoxetine protein 6-like [Toxorhynchites rutilus septentrionalis]
MNWITINWIVLLVHLHLIAVTKCEEFIDLAEYDKFPRLFEYDDFEKCRGKYRQHYVYCVVRAHIAPDDNSLLWKNISLFSKDWRHYDHRIVERGLCVRDYKTPATNAALDLNGADSPSEAQFFSALINQQLQEGYSLRIEPDIQVYHCYRKENESPPLDFLEILFLLITVPLILLVIFSTWKDLSLQNAQRYPNNYFAVSHSSSGERLMTAFSFPRNIRRLKVSTGSDIRRDLRFLEGFRFIQMLRVTNLHVIIAMVKAPQVNPEDAEKRLYRPESVHYVADFQSYVQTFFSISGMLLMINFLEHTRKNPDFSMNYFWDRLRARLYRIVPAYIFVLLLEMSITRRFSNGPLAQHFIGESQARCHQWWWTNVLFLNNYIQTDQPCLLHSWYLAADMQLYIFALCTLMMMWRWPFLKKYIFGVAIGWGVVITPLIIYLTNLPPVMTEDLKLYTEYNFGHRYFDLYQPFHHNVTIFFAGMMAGAIYHQYREKRKEIVNSWLLTFALVVGFCLYLVGTFTDALVVQYQPIIPPVLLAIYATGYKHAWGLFTTAAQLKLSLINVANPIKSYFNHPFFTVLGKMCYSFYLVHFTVIVQVLAAVKHPIYGSFRSIVEYTFTVCSWTLVYGLAICVVVEFPSNIVLRELLEEKPKKSVDPPVLTR